MLPLFENVIPSRKSSSIKLSVGIGVLIGENSSCVGLDVSVLGILLFLKLGLLHRLILPDGILSLSATFGVMETGVCGSFVLCTLELKSIFTPSTLSSTVLMEPSLALLDVVGANPLSLLLASVSSILPFGFLSAGCVSVGGERGGGIVTAIGGFAGRASSYRRVIMPLSVRVCCCGDAIDFVRRLPVPLLSLPLLSGAILQLSTEELTGSSAIACQYLPGPAAKPCSAGRVERAQVYRAPGMLSVLSLLKEAWP
jgi:hypothetical protein